MGSLSLLGWIRGYRSGASVFYRNPSIISLSTVRGFSRIHFIRPYDSPQNWSSYSE